MTIKQNIDSEEIQKFNYKYINKFDACWVMDDKENNLAGILSNPETIPNNSIYIGPQSRFQYLYFY